MSCFFLKQRRDRTTNQKQQLIKLLKNRSALSANRNFCYHKNNDDHVEDDEDDDDEEDFGMGEELKIHCYK